MINWRIYYDNDVTYSNEDGTWEDAPKHGVVCIVIRDPTAQWGRWVIHGTDYYCKYPDSDEPFKTNDLEPFYHRIGERENLVKYGRNQDQQYWLKIMDIAVKDPDFPIGTPRRRAKDWA